ncbi:MAG: putative quinol monooxygenase [Pseudomonadota bacterium]
MSFVVLVRFEIKADSLEAFMPLVVANARSSLREEPGCERFDVVTDPDRPCHVLLYEVYKDPAAFAIHLHSAHFEHFDIAVADMVADKSVETWREMRA